MDIKLNIENGDVVFTNGMDIVIDRADELRQRLIIRLRTFLGEWFINPEYGVPYFQQIFGKGRKKSTIDNIMQEQILADGDVLELVSFSSTLSADRRYTVDFRVQLASSNTAVPINIEVAV